MIVHAVQTLTFWEIAGSLTAAALILADMRHVLGAPKRARLAERDADYLDRWLKRQSHERTIEDWCWQYRADDVELALRIRFGGILVAAEIPVRLLEAVAH